MCNKELISSEDNVKIKRSDHIIKRLNKRANIKHGSQDRFLNKAIQCGIRYEDVTNNTLKGYLEKITREGYYTIIYQKYVLIISENSNVGTTIFNLPKQYWKIVDHIYEKKEGKKNVSRKRNRRERCVEEGEQTF